MVRPSENNIPYQPQPISITFCQLLDDEQLKWVVDIDTAEIEERQLKFPLVCMCFFGSNYNYLKKFIV